MAHSYFWRVTGRLLTYYLPWLLLVAGVARAQTPAWNGATIGRIDQVSGTCTLLAVTTDASDNVFVARSFSGVLTLGNITLSIAGRDDLLVAKYVPATTTWVWAQRGGTDVDYASGIAVSGNRVYVAGVITNSAGNASGVRFGGSSPAASSSQINGASPTVSTDILLGEYTDGGTMATLGWTQVGGGTFNGG